MILSFRNFALAALLCLAPPVAKAEDWGESYNSSVELTIKGQSEALTNFPLLVRISEAQLPGFKYDAENTASDNLAFVAEDGTALNYDVDTWDTSGESTIWVKIPELPTTGTTITMYWSLKEGETAPENNKTAVWSDYAGVWHMTDDSAATANAPTATQGADNVSTNGVFGYAFATVKDGEPILVVDTDDQINNLTNGTFTITFWTYLNSVSDGGTSQQYLFSRRETWANDGYAVYLHPRAPSDSVNIGLAAGDAGYKWSTTGPVNGVIRDGWMQNDIVYSKEDTKFYWYINGMLDSTHGFSIGMLDYATRPFANGAQDKIAIGGRLVTGSGADSNINGAIDEFRMRVGATDAIRAGAEYANAVQAAYLNSTDTDFIKTELVSTNGVIVDYWATQPSISTPSWIAGTLDESGFAINSGALKSGAAGEVYKCTSKNGSWSTNEVTAASLNALEPGEYLIYFRRTQDIAYSADDATVAIEVQADAGGFFDDSVTFTVKGAGTDLDDYPVLLRLSEAQLPGFKYSRANQNELSFSAEGSNVPLPYEVDEWNESGESLVWVKLPKLPAAGTVITMYWSLKEGKTAPGNDPTKVWSAYAGVWHMASAKDSSPGSASGTKSSSSSYIDGFVGKALGNNTNAGGPFITATPTDSINSLTNNGFVASFWLNINSFDVNKAFLFGRRTARYNTDGYGASFWTEDDISQIALFPGNQTQYFRHWLRGLTTNEWVHLDIVFAKRRFQCWVDGVFQTMSNAPNVPAPTCGDSDFAIGGAPGRTTDQALNGAIDEFRLIPYDASSYSARIEAEYANMTQTDYIGATDDSFIKPGMVKSGDEEFDYWSVPLEVSTNTWTVGQITAEEISVDKVPVLRSGKEVEYYYLDTLNPTNCPIASVDDIPAKLAALPEGIYRLCYASKETNAETGYVEIYVRFDMGNYTDWVDLTLNGIAEDTVITNYTLLVRVSEDNLPGFRYSRAGNGTKLAFVDETGAKLYYDVDTWNAQGESIVWVKVPFARKGSVIRFYWGIDGAVSAPSNDGKMVWSDYAGVWHMENTVVDAAGKSEDGTKHAKAAYTGTGMFAGALGRNETGSNGPIATVPSGDAINSISNDAFTVSAWVRLKSTATNWAYIFSRKAIDGTVSWGLQFRGNGNAGTYDALQAWYDGNSNRALFRDTTVFGTANEWVHVMVGYMSGEAKLWLNGVQYSTADIPTGLPSLDPTMDFYIGGLLSGHGTLNGDMDEVRIKVGAVNQAEVAAAYSNATLSAYRNSTDETFLKTGLVHVDGEPVDYWNPKLSLSSSVWEAGSAPESLAFTNGVLRSGAAVTNWCVNLTTGETALENVTVDGLKALSEGSYRIWNKSLGDYAVADVSLDFTVTKSSSVPVVGETSDGRILLMNHDWSQTKEITGQGWACTNVSKATFWEHSETNEVAKYNLKSSYISTLWTWDEGHTATNRLWHLDNCRHGNTFPSDNEEALAPDQNYLPFSAKSGSIDDDTDSTSPTDRAGVGQILMQNTDTAIVYSPCFDEGIGTIYFDAVNMMTNIVSVSTDGSLTNDCSYRIVVEFATNTTFDLPPTEANAHVFDEVTKLYAKLNDECWHPCESYMVSVSNSTMTLVGHGQNIDLNVTTGGKMDEFYRIYVPLEIRQPVRFRIRRVSTDLAKVDDPDDSFVLIDNIVASYPRMTASLGNLGYYDTAKKGSEILGYEDAFEPKFPAVGDQVRARAGISRYVNSGAEYGEPSSFFASAKMHYRWRYLNQVVGDWKVVELVPVENNRMVAKENDTLVLPGQAGDVEYWFESVLQAPYYRHVDYSGSNLEEAFNRIYTENNPVVVTNASDSSYIATCGTNWFVRLREGHSEYESMSIITRAAGDTSVCETNVMSIVSDGKWRGFVKTRSALEDGLEFRFEGVKLNDVVEGVPLRETLKWTSQVPMTNSLPATGGAVFSDGEKWEKVLCDAATGYLIFTYDESGTIGVGRGDHQNFNSWPTAAAKKGLFVGSQLDVNTSSYDSTEVDSDIANWAVSSATNKNWRESFSVGSGQIAAKIYPRDQSFSVTNLASGWTAHNASWTYERWACDFAQNGVFGGKTALQLEGCGRGIFSLESASDYPNGLDTVRFKARVAQFNNFNDFAYYNQATYDTSTHKIVNAFKQKNYAFATYTALTLNNDKAGYDGDGSVSLIACYDPTYGAYEARVSRGGQNGENLRFTLYRWSVNNGAMTCDVLGTNDFPYASVADLHRDNDNVGLMPVFYISVQEHVTENSVAGTLIHAGVSTKAINTSTSLTAGTLNNQTFDSSVYFDTSDKRLKAGTVGVLARNCAGAFLKPVKLSAPISHIGSHDMSGWETPNKINRYTNARVTFEGSLDIETCDSSDPDEYFSCWSLPPGRTLKFTKGNNNVFYWGFTGITNVSQRIAVQTATHSKSNTGTHQETDWTTVTNITVTGFADQTFDCAVRNHEQCDVRLKVLGGINDNRLDVTIDDVELTQWNGQSTPNYDTNRNNGFPEKYVYTSAWINQDNNELKTKAVKLQPARAAKASTPVSIRTPAMKGVGAFHIRWRNADSRAKFLVQQCKDTPARVDSNLISLTDAAADDTSLGWETIETLDFTDPASDYYGRTDGSETLFFTERYDEKNKTNTVLRLVADQSVVATIAADTTIALTDPEYGSIEILESYVWDLPPYDKRSWSGWNFRADGWAGEPSMWASLGDATTGLSGLLNNTVEDESCLADSKDYYRGNKPYIQSPTFEANCIGSVEFRARLYDPVFDISAGHPAVVSVYGANEIDKETGEPASWNLVTNVIVDSSSYVLKSAKLGEQYCALRFAVDGVRGITGDAGEPEYDPPLRVAIDDICVIEQPIPSIRFRTNFVRPFRNDELLKSGDLIGDIDSSAEQPIIGESFGFQAEVVLDDIENEIVVDDPEKPLRVYLAYCTSASPWGWRNWIEKAEPVELARVEDADGRLVYRSTISSPKSICPAQFIGGDSALSGKQYRLVQYHLYATYWDKSGEYHEGNKAHNLSASEWTMPEWDEGFQDPNSSEKSFSAFTLLEPLAPKQAWINEVNLSEPTRAASQTNQWIEIAVPSGVDMTGWKLRFINKEFHDGSLFTFGGATADAKVSNATEASGDYSFYLSQSVNTDLAGANATWYKNLSTSEETGGALNFDRPYGFELVRPTGIVEHRVVIQGKNQYEEREGYEDWAVALSGTNLVKNLKENVSDGWIWGDKDWYLIPDTTVGVTNGMGAVHEDWYSPMGRTPGALNENQYIAPGTFIRPNGGYVWIYSSLEGGNIRQNCGGETDTGVTVTMAEGGTTNIVFSVDKWYKLACTVEPDEYQDYTLSAPSVQPDGSMDYTLTLNNASNRIAVTSRAEIADDVAALINEKGEAYIPAIMNWLAAGVTRDGDGNETPFEGNTLTNAIYRGSGDQNSPIDLVGMYWLDLDPTKPGWELWGGNKEAVTTVVRESENFIRTNLQVKVWLMITNTVDNTAYPPYRLQGLNNEKSDEYTDNDWSSVNFKILMCKNIGGKWFAMRQFVFDKNSFHPADGTEDAFSALIEVADPNTKASPAYVDEWWNDDGPVLSKWNLDGAISPIGVSTLKENDVLKR